MRKILLTLLTTLLCSVTAWAANANISTAASPTGSAGSFYFIADGTAVTAIAGAGGHAVSYNSGSKITVQGKTAKKVATITFTIASGVTITSFTVNGTKNSNTTYDLNGTPVSTFGTAITGLSITSSMTFTLTCTDGTSSSSNRNTTITSIDLVYSTSGGSCSAPTSPSISGTAAYTAGNDISLTASATGTSASTTYTWYKGTDWATASASSPVQAASTSGATFSKASCSMSDAGTYWCNISNGTGCNVQVSKAITVSCKNPTQTFSNSDYTVGGAALNLASKFSSNSSGAVTYSVQDAGGTGASIAGTSFSATTEGTATVRASQAANGDYCAKTIDASVSVTADDCTDPNLTITLN